MIIALCLEYPIALKGGVSVLVETMLLEFVRLGHEVILVSSDLPGSLSETETGRRIKHHIYWKDSSQAKARQLAEELVAAGVEVAHFHLGGHYGWGCRFVGQGPFAYLNRRGVACITTAHMTVGLLDGFCGPQKPLWFKLLLFPFAWLGKMYQVFHVRAEIAVSDQSLHKLRRWYLPLRGRFRRIYHSRLQDQPISPDTSRDLVVLNVGHVARRKGQGILADAFAKIASRYPDWQLQLAGHDADGKTMQYIEQMTKDQGLGDRIKLLGERKDAQNLMRRAAIYVQPSFFEGLPLALQEAMFNACPVVGTYADGVAELIDHNKTGLLVPIGDSGEMAAALESLIQDGEKRQRMGAAGAAAIREKGMTAAKMVENHLALYAECLKSAK